jgi:hypothetical protein
MFLLRIRFYEATPFHAEELSQTLQRQLDLPIDLLRLQFHEAR